MDDMEIFKKLAQCEDKEQMQRVIEAHNASQKPQTNADRIRAMSDAELAQFLAERSVNESTVQLLDKDNDLTAVQIEAIRRRIYCALIQWLKQPVEVNENA